VINQVVVNSSTVTATIVIPPQNGVIGRVETVTVTTPGGKSNGLSFTVN
jgi:hypothetical protein